MPHVCAGILRVLYIAEKNAYSEGSHGLSPMTSTMSI